jgi:UDP-N-acetylglucosamine acyltransferase
MSKIHHTAIIESGASIGADVEIGAFCVIGPEVSLGDGSILHSHVSVAGNTTIGANARIFPFASVGNAPQDLKFKGEKTRLEIGSHVTIRENVTVNPGTEGGGGVTRLGDHVSLLAGAHIAHDCIIGDHVVLVNGAMVAGHCVIGEHVIIGGGSGLHQFVRVGPHAFAGGMSAIAADVIPYGMVLGNRAKLTGLNIVGLKRRGFSRDAIHALRQAYRLLFANEGTLRERAEDVAKSFAGQPLVEEILAFINADSDRPLCMPASNAELAD